jgi:hypothetical protein
MPLFVSVYLMDGPRFSRLSMRVFTVMNRPSLARLDSTDG